MRLYTGLSHIQTHGVRTPVVPLNHTRPNASNVEYINTIYHFSIAFANSCRQTYRERTHIVCMAHFSREIDTSTSRHTASHIHSQQKGLHKKRDTHTHKETQSWARHKFIIYVNRMWNAKQGYDECIVGAIERQAIYSPFAEHRITQASDRMRVNTYPASRPVAWQWRIHHQTREEHIRHYWPGGGSIDD